MSSIIMQMIDSFIYDHPEAVMQAIMHILVLWLPSPKSRSSIDLEKYRKLKFGLLKELLLYMQEIIDREKYLQSEDVPGDGSYSRRSFPSGREIPTYQWKRSQGIIDAVLPYLQSLSTEDALHFYSELVVAWFFTCPETLLRLTPRYIGGEIVDQNNDTYYTNALWLWFQQYLSDPAWFS